MKTYIGKEINQIVPNQYPLMFLDSLDVETGKRASGYKRLKGNDWFFLCHYPGYPILPATLLVESMTQVLISTFITKRNDCAPESDWNREDIPVLVRIGEFRMKQSLHPGDAIKLDAQLLSFKRGIAKGKCQAHKIESDGKETLVTEIHAVFALPQEITPVCVEESK